MGGSFYSVSLGNANCELIVHNKKSACTIKYFPLLCTQPTLAAHFRPGSVEANTMAGFRGQGRKITNACLPATSPAMPVPAEFQRF